MYVYAKNNKLDKGEELKAIAIEQYGGVEQLKSLQLPIPELKNEEVLVCIKAIGVNAVDTYFREGYLGDGTFPLIMGSDFSGVVTKIGNNVSSVAVGDEVYGYKYLGNGTYAEFAAVDESLLAKKPANTTFEEAAVLPCAGLIAVDSIVNTLRVQAGETILITGASGGVGMIAVQVAKSRGAIIIATASSKNLDFVRALGADVVIDYSTDWVSRVNELYPGGVDTALATAEATVKMIIHAVNDNGRLTWITGPDGSKLERGITGSATNGSRGTELLNQMSMLVQTKAIHTIHIDHTFTLDEAKEAQIKVIEGGYRGKLVIKI